MGRRAHKPDPALCAARSKPWRERLQLAAARIMRRPIAIMREKCLSVGKWIARYAKSSYCPSSRARKGM
jgi:hypothetical protein